MSIGTKMVFIHYLYLLDFLNIHAFTCQNLSYLWVALFRNALFENLDHWSLDSLLVSDSLQLFNPNIFFLFIISLYHCISSW